MRFIDGPQSVVFDEAEKPLHAQKSILAWCMGAGVTAEGGPRGVLLKSGTVQHDLER